MNEQEKLAFGIEIVSAMKASAYGVDIETGRSMALEDTELDRMPDITMEEFNSYDERTKEMIMSSISFTKKRLHDQALFVADIALRYLSKP